MRQKTFTEAEEPAEMERLHAAIVADPDRDVSSLMLEMGWSLSVIVPILTKLRRAGRIGENQRFRIVPIPPISQREE